MSPDEARRRPLMALGGMEQTQEQHRAQRDMPILDELVQDLRYAVRVLRESPTYAGAAMHLEKQHCAAAPLHFYRAII